MSKKALLDQHHELIKAHILDPENSPLPEQQKAMLERVVSMSKVLDKNPVAKNAIAVHLSKYPEIGSTTAYNDLVLARRIYNSLHEFDYDFWLNWALGDIIDNIKKCRDGNSSADRKIIAQEHANLIRAIGVRPEEITDPARNEKHQFYIMVNLSNKVIKIDQSNLHKLPEDTLRELNRALISGNEIDEQGAVEIMNS